MARIAHGTFTGTGAAINVPIGFIPSRVTVVNITDGDERWERWPSMTAAHAIKIAADGTQTRITANGLSDYAGDISNPQGFTAGSAVSEAAKVFAYEAVLEDDFN